MIINYLTIAWRNLRKHPGFSLLNIGGLALGMTSCLLLLLYISYHLSYNRQYGDISRTYLIENNQPGDGKIYTFASTPGVMADAIKTTVPGVEQVSRVVTYSAEGLIGWQQQRLRMSGIFADHAFFSIFNYHFIKGNAATALAQPNSIVITDETAKALFGNQDPMNKLVKRNNSTALMVSGVIKKPAQNSSFQFDYVLPWALFETENASWIKTSGWGNNFCQILVQLKSNRSYSQADAVVRKMLGLHQDGDKGSKSEAFLYPFGKRHLYSQFENGKPVGGLIEQVHLFEVLAVCILLIACANFMNLSTARSEERAKEVGIRKAIGSSRRLLIRQFMAEAVLMSFIAMVISVLLLVVVVPFFNQWLNLHLSIPYQQGAVYICLLGFAILTGVVSGSYPAFYLSSFEPIKVLKGVFKGGKGAVPVRKVLVVIQFAFTVFLITATICIYRQINFVKNKPIGFDKGNMIEIPAEGNLQQSAEVLVNRLKNEGVITAATSFSTSINNSGNNTWGVSWPGKQEDQKVLVDIFHVGFNFIEAAGTKLVQGREFSAQFPADTAHKTVMINQALANIMHLKHPVGAIITWDGQPLTVIGIYQDFVWGAPYEKTRPMISECYNGGSIIALRLNSHNSIGQSVSRVESALKEMNPAYPPDLRFVDSDFEQKFQNEQLLGRLANLFGGLAIIISCLGLLGMATYAAEQRVKEIGVRKVLGASVAGLTALLSKDFLKLVGIAIIIAIPFSIWILNKWLQHYEYRIDLNWWMMALAGLITIIIALATVSFQAVKAALANPIKSLRSE